jgi:hypothetical protein
MILKPLKLIGEAIVFPMEQVAACVPAVQSRGWVVSHHFLCHASSCMPQILEAVLCTFHFLSRHLLIGLVMIDGVSENRVFQ